jgi:hypothetical protein
MKYAGIKLWIAQTMYGPFRAHHSIMRKMPLSVEHALLHHPKLLRYTKDTRYLLLPP